jgi:plastocyanin
VRRHPLGDRPGRPLGGIGAALLLVGCVAAGPGATATPSTAVDVTIGTASGETLAFEPPAITVRAAGEIAMTFRNDSSVAHNLVFTGGLTAATSTIVEPGSSEQLVLIPPAPGSYPFVCTIHDGMSGKLIALTTGSVGDPAAAP